MKQPPVPNWRGIVEKVWRVVTDWETDYEEGAHERAARGCHRVVMETEEGWQDYSRWEFLTNPHHNHEHLAFLKGEARYYWHRYRLHYTEHRRYLWHQRTRKAAMEANQWGMRRCYHRFCILINVIRWYEPQYVPDWQHESVDEPG